MAKEIAGQIKLQIKGGAANPSPPVGPALGSKGINIMDFCKQFNARTQAKAGKVLPVVISYYADKSFDFIVKTSPVPVQLIEAAKIKGGSGEPNRVKVASVTWDQVKEIAEDKMPDLNCFTLASAMRMVAGTARSMGITVKGQFPISTYVLAWIPVRPTRWFVALYRCLMAPASRFVYWFFVDRRPRLLLRKLEQNMSVLTSISTRLKVVGPTLT